MAFMFEKLEVYQKAVDFTDHACALTEGFPRGYGFLADQLNRASFSPIPAHIPMPTLCSSYSALLITLIARLDTQFSAYELRGFAEALSAEVENTY